MESGGRNYGSLLKVLRPSQNDSEFNVSREPHLISQAEIYDFVRDLKLNKQLAEILSSRLQEWNLLQPGTKITYRKRELNLSSFFTENEQLVYCNDINGLMVELGREHNPQEWRLFIDSSKLSLKAVLLHYGNIYPSVPVAYSITMKETYDSMKTILQALNYPEHGWQICADLKVIGMVRGMHKILLFLV